MERRAGKLKEAETQTELAEYSLSHISTGVLLPRDDTVNHGVSY